MDAIARIGRPTRIALLLSTWWLVPGSWQTVGAQRSSYRLLAQSKNLKDRPYPGTIELHIDATDVRRHILTIHETIPVRSGAALTLLYPQWTPGDHTPNGSLDKLAGLVVSGNGQRISWTRDPVSVYAFHIQVPAEVHTIDLAYQYLGATGAGTGPVLMTRTMLDLQWQSAVLYPDGYYARDVKFAPTVTLPEDWTFFSALDGARRTRDVVNFAPVSLETLVDSPVMAGKFARQVVLSTNPMRVALDVVADDEAAFERVTEAAEKYKSLQDETSAFFPSHPYDHYDHMLWLSDELGPVYYEHHRSGENSRPGNFLKGSGPVPNLSFIEHGYVHSWNGMYRRPVEMTPPNLNTPQRDSLFWVFEGLTEYWSHVLSTRAGVTSKEETLSDLARMTAYATITEGAQWRTLQDVNNMPIFAFHKASSWGSWQRDMFDAYSQGELLWLAVDTKMRQQSSGRVSLDDFARSFFAGREGSYRTLTYTLADMTAALNRICPYDWNEYLKERLNEYGTQKSLEGITAGGYKLVYNNETTPPAEARSLLNLAFSIGIQVATGGKIVAVHWEGPAFKAGLIPGGTIVSVNGAVYSPALLESVIAEAAEGGTIHLQVTRFGDNADYSIDWHGGLRQPRLVRLEGSPDLLGRILSRD